MKTNILKAFLCFLFFSCFSVNASEYDSLLTVIKKASAKNKIKPLQDLADICVKKNLDSALLLSKQAMKLAIQYQDKASQAKSLRIDGVVYRQQNKFDKSESTLKQAISISTSIHDKIGEMKGCYALGRLYEIKQEFDVALIQLKKVIEISKSTHEPSTLGNTYESMGRVFYYKGNYDGAIYYFKLALKEYVTINDQESIAGISMNLGIMCYKKGNNKESMKYYVKALNAFKSKKDTLNEAKCNENIALTLERTNIDSAIVIQKRAISLYKLVNADGSEYGSLLNLGSMYNTKGDYSKAVHYSLKAVKIAEDNNDLISKAKVYLTISEIYSNVNRYEKALDYAHKGINLTVKSKNEAELISAYMVLSNIYSTTRQYDKAIENANKSLELSKKLNSQSGISLAYLALGNTNQRLAKPKIALDYFLKSLALVETDGDDLLISGLYSNIGVCYYDLKNYSQANIYYKKSLDIRKGIGSPKQLSDSYETLANINFELKNYKEAYNFQKLFIANRELLLNENVTKQISEVSAKYETEKKATQIKLLKKEKINQSLKYAEAKKRTLLLIVAGAIFTLLCILIAGILYRSNLRKKKDNELLSAKNSEILTQKLIVENKNKEILDSIIYAKRIQTAILTPERVIKESLQDSFVIYLPKDIVAGDFYWMRQSNDKTYFAVADCTGHGVPGAMVSVICNNSLNKSLAEYHLIEPGDILTKTRELVIAEFEKSNEDVKDGMDIALCCLEGNILKYAGANNPLWLIRNGQHQIEEIKANKQAVGKVDNPTPFETHTIELSAGDTIYIFSDGYADQFGGQKGKKLKYSKFKELILEANSKEMNQQRNFLLQEFENWKGSIEQLDDVCVIGVRI
jgi:tetratricopeptide (TPR) repeat protein